MVKMGESRKIAIVIAGATGDLARRKLVPALARLFSQGKLGSEPLVIGTGRSYLSDDEFSGRFAADDAFRNRMHYHQHIEKIRGYIETFGDFDRVIFFLSLPPQVYPETAQVIAAEGFGERASIIIEKPFGSDVASAHRLNSKIAEFFSERQIFRIDHYLAKEAVQNILVFRFANSLFYPVWNSRYVESIQISALETEDLGNRSAYFDRAGILRDMVQNHLLQLLCLLTMEAPLTLDPEDIRAQKIQILRALRIDECHRFQYEGYRDEKGVAADSVTETYAEVRMSINNFRWTGMPIYLRTGKKMHRKGTEIGIRFKRLPKLLFNEDGKLLPNQIIFKIQPAEGIIVDIQSKLPGTDISLAPSKLNFCFTSGASREAYERLLYDVVRDDHTLFVSAQESEEAWKVMAPVLDKGTVATYPAKTLPAACSACEWIDFDNYVNDCVPETVPQS